MGVERVGYSSAGFAITGGINGEIPKRR